MERLDFEHLLELYRNTEFTSGSREGVLTVASAEVKAVLERIDADPEEAKRTGLALLDDARSCVVGDRIHVEVGSPRPAIGILVDSFDDLLRSPDACFSEPQNYFVIEGKIERKTTPPHRLQTIYRQVLAVLSIIAEAATFADRTRRELVFVGDSRLVIPALFRTAELDIVNLGQSAKFSTLFDSPTHRDQKLGILNAAIVRMVQSLPREDRLRHVLTNLDIINDDIQNGYRLFASSFSYSKVRSELAAAKLEFTGKIHKTIVDIQGQLLGIPAATIIVATQMKEPQSCLQSWANTAIIAGAWAFVALLILALINQWLTLSAISAEINRQKRKLETDYADLGSDLTSTFNGLATRICWHRIVLFVIGIVSCAGAAAASVAYIYLIPVSPVCS
ncbi:hypothetical protein DFR48_110186 [Ciceribacter lividus]|uniref:Uncharacterized protein n=1 Tax=Ciceribacter lividus TaxID=1197950 RepID=A0A6I7HK23_9HYPH|nr:hypothetical protein [Ciceribacter lividus]RCW21597.1 hypothetical protein DFR48_110186 [Ciceribacter lividus]